MANIGFFRLYQLVPLCAALIAGILAGRGPGARVGVEWLVAGFAAVFAVALVLGRRPKSQTAAILLAAFLFGAALVCHTERSLRVDLPQGETAVEGIIADEPVERGRILRFDMLVVSGRLAGRSLRVALLKDTVGRRYSSLSVGDGVVVRSRLEPPANFRESNFDYATYLRSRGIVATTFVFYRDWRQVSPRLGALSLMQRVRVAALSYRHRLLRQYRSLGLAGQDFAVVAAMTLGDKSSLSADIRDAYSVTGASHILALSGMHLGIIYALLSVLSLGRRLRLVRECLLLSAIWAYVFLVGLSPSVLRSALMISLYALVGLTGRSRMSVNALAFAAVVLLVANPLTLFDIGFQLSFAAVAFILAFQSPVGSLIPYSYQQRHRLVCWAWQLFVMSLLAQVGTAPLVAYYFGRLPVYSLLSNFVVIPAATAILYSAVALFALSAIPMLQQVAASVLAFVVASLNSLLLFVASLPGASVGGLRLNGLQVALLYVVAVCVCRLLALWGRHAESARGWGG